MQKEDYTYNGECFVRVTKTKARVGEFMYYNCYSERGRGVKFY